MESRVSSVVNMVIVVGAILALPALGYAQEVTLSGTVTDSTGGVVPGTTVTAVHEASGNVFEAVTDASGRYRIPVRPGVFKVTAQLVGFQTVTRTGLELLVGQQAVMNFQLAPSTVQETVTVTGEAPLVNVSSSTLEGNVDPRQMQQLPVNGRNFMDLSILAPGNRANASTDQPTIETTAGHYQINVDGQQVTNQVVGGFGQARYSRDAIGEFEFISNRFDATQGRSVGVQVNVVTKSGTNVPGGSFSGYFRNDKFNAADPVAKRVLPYSDQQVSGTFGGPIVKDKIHFFGNYEYERNPQTFVYTTPYPRFNTDLFAVNQQHTGGGRVDAELSSKARLAVRYSKWIWKQPYRTGGGATTTPSAAEGGNRYTDQAFSTLTQVLSNRAVNEIKGGYSSFHWCYFSNIKNPNSPALDCTGRGGGWGGPAVRLSGIAFGASNFSPQEYNQKIYNVRDDFTYSFTARGHHDLKLGGEYYRMSVFSYQCVGCIGQLDALAGRPPANLEDLFPDQFDMSTWKLAALSPNARTFTQGVGTFGFTIPRNGFGTWLQDDWAITSHLTLNLGLRYDVELNTFANEFEIQPFLPGNRPNDLNNVGPRVGFAYQLNDRTVIRGGGGKYYGADENAHGTQLAALMISPIVSNDGRPDFASNPFNGPTPTFDQAIAKWAAGGSSRTIALQVHNPITQTPAAYQTSIGMQRQIGDAMSFQADYVWTGDRLVKQPYNINLSYNPETGINYPFTDLSHRIYPGWSAVNMRICCGRDNYNALQTSLTKRFSNRWQAAATYTLAGYKEAFPKPVYWQGFTQLSWPNVAPWLGGEYGLGPNDQRHRAVFNGIWDVGYGIQLSGLYFYGSGTRFATTYGSDLAGLNGATARDRLRPNGTIVPYNNLVGAPVHRVDMRLQRKFRLGGRARVDGIAEVFNVFNHANFGSYTTTENSAVYGKPTANTNLAYAPREAQFGFRFTF